MAGQTKPRFRKLGYLARILGGVRMKELNKSLSTAKARSGKGKARLFLDMLWCSARYGAGYHDYVMFGFYDMDGKHRDTYVTRIRNKRLITLLNDPAAGAAFSYKSEFDTRFRAYLGRDFLPVKGLTREALAAFVAGKPRFFAKPDVGECGTGIERLEPGSFSGIDALYDYIMAGNFGVLEDELHQHPDMARLYPHGVNCLRIVTVLAGSEGAWNPVCIYAVIKTGAGGKFVDNLESGGLFCPVDPETGIITGVGHTASLHTLETQPDTGIPLVGYRIPMVKEAIALCLRAAQEESRTRFVGWDVAVTPDGPAIIEGNPYPGYDFWQQPEHTPDRIGLWPTYLSLLPELSGKSAAAER